MRESGTASEIQVTSFIDELIVALVNGRIYWTGHPRVLQALAGVERQLQLLTARESGPPAALELTVDGEGLAIDGCRLWNASLGAARLVQCLRDRGIGGVVFHGAAGESDFRALLDVLSDASLERIDLAAAGASLAANDCRWIRLLPPREAASTSPIEIDEAWLPDTARLHQRTVAVLQEAAIAASLGEDLPFDELRATTALLHAGLRTEPGAMLAIARYEQYDAYTFGHVVRVALLAMQLADSLTQDAELVQRIGLAALLHDIGKVRLPFEILYSQGWLTAEQRRELMRHAVYGAEILLAQKEVDSLVVGVAFGHHLAFRGRGYPRTLIEEPASPATRIVKICDVFEALTGVRPHKPAMTPTQAFRTMLAMSDHFDPALLHRFIDVHGVYPAGARVALSSGAVVRVARQSGDLLAPVVALDLPGAHREVDLSLPERRGPIRVTGLA